MSAQEEILKETPEDGEEQAWKDVEGALEWMKEMLVVQHGAF